MTGSVFVKGDYMGYSNDEIIKKTEGYFDIIVDRMAAITRIKVNNEGIYNRELEDVQNALSEAKSKVYVYADDERFAECEALIIRADRAIKACSYE